MFHKINQTVGYRFAIYTAWYTTKLQKIFERSNVYLTPKYFTTLKSIERKAAENKINSMYQKHHGRTISLCVSMSLGRPWCF